MEWADTQCLSALRDCPAPTTRLWGCSRTCSRPSTSGSHGCKVASRFGRAGRHCRLPTAKPWPPRTLPGYAAYIEELAEARLTAVIRYRNSQGDEFANTVLDILTHVVIHGAYHRGQIAKAIGKAGGKSVNTDYIIFARSVEPMSD